MCPVKNVGILQPKGGDLARRSVSNLSDFVAFSSDQPVFIGIDAHRISFYLARIRPGDKLAHAVFPAEPAAILRLVERGEAIRFAICAGFAALNDGAPSFKALDTYADIAL